MRTFPSSSAQPSPTAHPMPAAQPSPSDRPTSPAHPTPTDRPTSPAVEFVGVSKAFGATPALTDVTFTIGRGEIVALLGPNGAGKSTTVNTLLGLLRPDAGAVRVLGVRPDEAVA